MTTPAQPRGAPCWLTRQEWYDAEREIAMAYRNKGHQTNEASDLATLAMHVLDGRGVIRLAYD